MREILPIFDVDDTIVVGSTPMYNYCYQKGLAAVGVDLDDRGVRNATDLLWGGTHTHQFTHILNGDEEKVRIASDEYMEQLRSAYVEAVGVLPGTFEALGSLSIKPALASGIHPEILKEILKKYDVDPDFFDPVVTSYDIPHHLTKPNPFMVYEVLQRRALSTGETFSTRDTVVIGDSINDMLMGTRAGSRTIAVLTGRMSPGTARELTQPEPGVSRLKVDCVVDSVVEVPEVITKLKRKNR